MVPHLNIHGRCHDDGCDGGQVKRTQEIIGDALGKFGQDIGGSRGHQQEMTLSSQVDMLDLNGMIAE